MQFFVNPKDTTRLYPWEEMGSKEWVDVKSDLSAREEQEIRAAGIPHVMGKASEADMTPEEQKKREVKMGLDMGRMALVRARCYIVGWSLTNNGAPVPVTETTIGELLPHVFDALDKALDKHKAAMEAAKKPQTQAGTSTSKSA